MRRSPRLVVARRGRTATGIVLVVVAALVAAITVVAPTAAPAQATVGPLSPTLVYDQQVYGDFVVAGNAVLVCPANNTQCLSGANDSTSSTTINNDSFAMTPTGANTSASPAIFDSSSAQVTIPAGATVSYAQLTWAGSLGQFNSSNTACGSGTTASRPPGMAANATPSNTPVQLTVGGNAAVPVLPGRENEDGSTVTGNQRFYSARTDVTSAFANATSGSPLTITAANVFAYQGQGCMGGWSIQVVYDFKQPTAAAPDKKEVFIYDGHVRVASGVAANASITGFRANGPARVGVVAYEGDNGITGDFFNINTVAQKEPRTGKSDNFFISNAAGESNPTFANNYSVDAKTIDVPATVIKPGDTTANLQFGSTGDSYLAQEIVMSVAIPALKIEKSVSPSTVHPGDTVTFTIKVTNPTTAVANSVVVDDPNAPACNKTIGTLAGGASTTYTCTYVASKDITNTANVSGKSSFNDALTGTAFVPLRVLQPAVAISKTADAPGYHVGDTVTFTVTVTNTGDTGLSNMVVTDAKTPSCARTVGPLAAGDSTTYTCTATAPVTGDANTAIVTGVDSLGGAKGTVTATSTAPAPTIHPSITLLKTASPTVVTAAGQQVTYSFTVTNTSADAPLTGIGITDTLTSPAGPEPTISCPTTSLAPGASTVCSGVYTVTQADVDKGTIHNSATATGTDTLGRKFTSAPSAADVTATRTPKLSLVKSADPSSISSIGAAVAYRFTVRNTGNVTVNGITVNDVFTSPATDVVPTITCPATSLAPGATTICTASYTSVPADFDNGTINNSATATGTSTAGPATSNISTATVTTIQGPSLTIAKSASPTTITAPRAITYTFVVTNNGSVTVRNLSVTDTFTGVSAGDTAPTVSCPVSQLAAGASTTCTATYNATQGDVDRGTITNSATANGTAPNGSAVAALPSTATVSATRTPKLTLVKSVSPLTAAKAGDIITYSFAVTNAGNVTITALGITDPMFPGAAAPACTVTTLPPGQSTTCTKPYVVTQADVDAGAITNTATAGGTAPGNSPVTSPPSTAKVTIAAAAHLSLTKSVNPTSVTAAGQNVTYSFAVVNDGNVTVTGLSIADTLAAPAGPALTVNCPVTFLAPGNATTCTATYRVTPADVDNGVISNSATANGKNPAGGAVASDPSTASVTAGSAPAISLVKSASPQTVSAVGDVVTYTFGVTNIGNVTLANIAVSDPRVTNVTCLATSLAAGASTSCTGSYVTTLADLDRGSIVNTATVAGDTPKGVRVPSPPATATVQANQLPALTLQKSATPGAVAASGDTVVYRFAVKNTGNVTVSSLAITDTFTAPAGPALDPIACVATSLAPGASTTCQATYTVTQDDVDNGSINNRATASGSTQTGAGVTSNTSTASVSAADSPSLTLAKSVSPSTATTAGTTTTYSFVVTNNGNLTVNGIVIVDPMFTGAGAATCPVTSLAPRASTTCTATRNLTQADVDAGKVTNTARATGATPGGQAVTSNQSRADVTIPATTALELTKQASPTTVTTLGSVITYTFGVHNTGNVTIRGLTIADSFTAPAGSLDAEPVCVATTLAPDASTTCTATYTVTQRDIDAGTIKNSATAGGIDPSGGPVTSPAATATVTATKTASMTLLKGASVSAGTLTAAGQKIDYTFDVTNTGNVTLSLLGVQDILDEPADRTIAATCPTTTLLVGATVRCTASYTVTQDDIDAGSVDNTATATARDPQGVTIPSNPSSASVGVARTPAIELAKSASPTTVSAAGQSVTYTFTVHNTGNVRVHALTIADPMFTGASAAVCPTAPLDPEATATCTATHVVTQADIDAGGFVNTARAGSLDPTGVAVTSGPATATVTATRSPGLTLAKKAAPSAVDHVGQLITYTFTVTNSGNTTVDTLAISDPRLPAPNAPVCPATPLLPGATVTCTATYAVTLVDMNAGTIPNTATATATGPGGVGVQSPPDTATVDVTRKPAVDLVKSAAGGPVTRAGQVITYNFDVTNTGNVSVTVLAIVDTLTAPAAPPLAPITCADTTLDPAGTTRCTASYTVTQADVNNGSINNSAFARAEDPTGTILVSPPSNASVPITPAAGLTVVKSADTTTVTQAGQRITYSFVATNTGNVTLSLLAVQDTFTKAAGTELQVSCPDRTLDPRDSATCAGVYTVTQGDIDAGSIVNLATASAQQPGGTTIVSPPSDPVTVGVAQAPALSVVKSASRDTVTAAGQVVDYSFLVTNTGNTTVTGIAIADPMFTGALSATCPLASLAPGFSTTCTASYRTTQADIDAGSINNTAQAAGTDPAGAPVTSLPSTATVTAPRRAHLTLTKSANPQSISVVGTEITYSFTVFNDGNVTVTDLAITDPMFVAPGDASCPTQTLLPGESVVCTASYTSVAADFNVGSIVNTARAGGTTSVGPVRSAPSTATVTAAQNARLELLKSATPAQVSAIGQIVSYRFDVTNVGNVTLNDVAIDDPMFTGADAPVCAASSLVAGGSTVCTASHTVTQADLDLAGGKLINTAAATGDRPNGNVFRSADSSATVTIDQSPALTVDKTADPMTISAPGPVQYSFLVTNTGNVTIRQVAIDDPSLANVTCPQPNLRPTRSETCTATYQATQADIDRGSIKNTARATGTGPGGSPVESPSDSVTVTAPRTPALSLVKSITSPVPVTAAGQIVSYRFVLTNSGNVTVTAPSINDTLTPPAGPALALTCPATASLAPLGTLVCTAQYTVTQTDLEQGFVDNSATGGGTDPSGAPVPSNTSTASAPITQAFGLTIDKQASPATAAKRGDLVTYTFMVTNTGNTAVHNVAVQDLFTAPAGPALNVSCPSTDLGPAGSATDSTVCTARYTTTQADVDHGRIDNLATASATGPGDQPITAPADTAAVIIAATPGLTVTKTATPTVISQPGDTVAYSFEVTNTGNVTLTGIAVADTWTSAPAGEDPPAVDCPVTVLAPTEKTTCTAGHVVTQADLDRGELVNSAVASGTPPTGPATSSQPDTATVTADQTPSLSLLKSADPQTVSFVDDTVTYSFLVTNTGNVTVDGITVTDAFDATSAPLAPVDCPVTSLAPGKNVTCTADYPVTQDDLNRGTLTNTASAAGTGPAGQPAVSNESTAAVAVTQAPELTLEKSVTPTTVTAANQTVDYSFHVTNTGNVTVDDLTIDDTLAAPATPALVIDCPVTTLDPDADTTCTGTYTVTQADVDHGSVDNSAVAHGRSPLGAAVASLPDDATVTIPHTDALTVLKTADPQTVKTAGQRVTYSFLVTNTGNTTITDVSIDDDLTAPAGPALTTSCPDTTLLPNAETICTAVYRVTQDDIDHGSIHNSATARGAGPGAAPVTSLPSEFDVTADRAPALSLVKTPSVDTVSKAGEIVTYSFEVTNIGNVTVTELVVSDVFTAPAGPPITPTCPVTTLLPSAHTTCTADYPVTPADLDHGSIANLATASGTAPGGPISSPTAGALVTTIAQPAIALVKHASVNDLDGNGRTDLDDSISWTFTVTNTGNVTLDPVTIDDVTAGAVTCPDAPLAAGAGTECAADAPHVITQADVDAGKVDNTATATGTDPFGTAVASDPSSTSTTIPTSPSISLVKSADPETATRAGQTVRFNFLVTNTGDVTISAVGIVDTLAAPAAPALTIQCPTASIGPAGTTTCYADYLVTQADADNGGIDNSAVASGSAPNGSRIMSDESAVTVPIASDPSLTVQKSADPQVVADVGDTVSYSFLVTNTGNVTLHAIAIQDTLTAPAGPALTVTCPADPVLPTKTTTCTARYEATLVDLNHGAIDNSATASGTAPDGTSKTSPPSMANVTATQSPELTVLKTASPKTVTKVGQAITYTFDVTNTGNVTVAGIAIADTFTAPAGPAITPVCDDLSLDLGMSTTCTATYAASRADFDNGTIANSARATGTTGLGQPVESQPSTETVTAQPIPAITLIKTASPNDLNGDGETGVNDTISYSFLVTNTGNVTLSMVAITDPLAGAVNCAPDPLPAGESITCTAAVDYRITQADVDAGRVDNSAQVAGTDPFGTVVNGSGQTTTPIGAEPAIALAKAGIAVDSNHNGRVDAGDRIDWTFRVTNTGNVTLHAVTVTDPVAGSISCPLVTLPPGSTTICTADDSHVITQREVDAGSVSNTASVSGLSPGGDPVDATSTATVPLPGSPDLSLVKNALVDDRNDSGAHDAGDVVTWTFLVTNDGNVTIADIAVADPTAGTVTCPHTELAPGRSMTCRSAGHTITAAESASGRIVNTATATGTGPGGDPITSKPSTATVTMAGHAGAGGSSGGGATGGGPAFTGPKDLPFLVWFAGWALLVGMLLLAGGSVRRRRA